MGVLAVGEQFDPGVAGDGLLVEDGTVAGAVVAGEPIRARKVLLATNGFAAEFLLIPSTLDTHTGAGLAALAGVVLGAACFLGIYRRAFLGQAHNGAITDDVDLWTRELWVVAVPGILVLAGGFYPESVILTREV